ncbi:MAG: UDP-N-acetylmuramoyl-L-alanine--D-glutamate ligase [Armatimonadota bacterium]
MTNQNAHKTWLPRDFRPSPLDIEGRRVGLLGMGRSGMALARFLTARGAEVVVADEKSAEDLAEAIAALTALGAETVTGIDRFEQLGKPDLLVTSPGVPFTHHLLEAARDRGIPVIGEIELAYRFCAAPIIAATGTNGKGTTVTMIGDMLRTAGIVHRVAGNIGVPLVSVCEQSPQLDVVVAEISSFQLETVETFAPWVSVLLNIAMDHADRHSDPRAYREMKARIFANQGADDFAVLNTDDPTVAGLAGAVPAQLLTVAHADTQASGYVENDVLTVRLPGQEAREVCPVDDLLLPGRHHVSNALCACVAAGLCGVSADRMATAIRQFSGAAHMLDNAGTIAGVTFVDDSKATNPQAAIADIAALDRPLVVIAGGLGKDADFAEFADVLAESVKHVVLIGASAEQIRAAINDRTGVQTAATMTEAVSAAFEAAKPGDTVALVPACASFDMFDGQAQRGDAFCQAVDDLRAQMSQ